MNRDIELSVSSYQSVSTNAVDEEASISTPSKFLALSPEQKADGLKHLRLFGKTALYGVVFYLSILGLIGLFAPDSHPSVESSAIWPATGASLGTSYCKTSCDDSCASYGSSYGPLCCDWSYSPDSSKKYCAQSIDSDGTCLCGVTEKAPRAPARPTTPSPTPSKINSDMHPWPTMAWLPFDDDKKSGGGGSSMDPPADATPCKKHCDNQCGMSGGLCCDYSPSGACDMYSSQNNGKYVCLCGTK